ncbi:MAG: hypothetical protein BWY99_02334 [Synergistetes bacterium ADurb.BinA166]|nr:MAG: hypothetical protein BWY99_02334 [Synergistetes bacterium ADurb.BinA166]
MSMNHFPAFAHMVAASFQDRVKDEVVFVADLDGDDLYARYLSSFPEGTNPTFKVNTEHDCACCRHFIRRAGTVVSVMDGVVRTVWDQAANKASGPYKEVATSLRDAVRAVGIRDLFRVGANETQFGAQQTRSLDVGTQKVVTWDHFYTGDIPRSVRAAMPDSVRGDYRTTVQVFERGLKELSADAVDTVLSLISSNALYRGEEHKQSVSQFRKMQREFLTKDQRGQALFAWVNAGSPAARFRNTVIGTLVQDISEGRELEAAVAGFESKVAPQNYKRTTALITPGMVKKAMETVESLGLEPALERRFAVMSDISVNDVKWVDGAVKPLMKGGIGDLLMDHASASSKPGDKDAERAEPIGIDDFMSKILPETTGMEILFTGSHVGNLMSLTAPKTPDPKQLFRWSNDFAWSYGGNVADSIKERVKKAGGQVTGTLRISLSWYNFDDLDLHVHEPEGRGMNSVAGHIHFRNKTGRTGGKLDVDMNAGTGTTREPVENVIWTEKVPDGPYRVVVNNYNQRETSNPGFVVEIESGGKVSHFSYNKSVRSQQDIPVCTVHVKTGLVERIDPGDPGISSSSISQEKWGLTTEKYAKVSAVTLSPNYWGDNAVGNKHFFFVVEGAKNDEPTRGFYNEFLHPRLEPHRKVFEVIADKTKCQPTEGQLSGLGFSSTKKDSFLVRVRQGKKSRIFNVNVGA